MKLIRALLVSAALAIGANGAAAVAQPQADTVDTAIPTQLPRTAVPSHYAITVTPYAERLAFDASATIDLRVIAATRTLVLNAADLTIAKASMSGRDGRELPAKVSLDADAQTATFDFGRVIAPGNYRLAIDYAGKISKQANGLFALDYKNVEGQDARALFTQFEAPDARRFVPSWDEPNYKAHFDLTARVPAGQMAVSNMPAAPARAIGNGLTEVKFATTPMMSTYLLFFGLGDFERITRQVGDTEVGIVMSRGNADKARYALDAEAQLLPYFDDYFATPYPLPKLDNVAGPGQSQFFGAMENWGAIFTFERILLIDPAITTERDRQAIFAVEAHEIAHQWFGNLVTMAWWDDLWLNEGFASWMGNRATQHFHPDWGADVDQVAGREQGMALDSFVTTHPVIQSVRTVEQANQAFDSITYEKGQSVITMLEGFAGADTWRSGIRSYMRKHAYQNTRTDDLWAAMEGAGATGLTAIAHDFTKQPGIPLIVTGAAQCVNGNTVVPITQSQFSNDQKAEVEARPLSWHVPVRASAGGQPAQIITRARASTLQASGCGPLLINVGQTGYYRTLYTPEQSQALAGVLPQLSPVDQYGVVSDGLALSRAGYQPMGRAIDLLAVSTPGTHQKIAQLGLRRWAELYDDVAGDAAEQAVIAARMARAYQPRLAVLGFAPRPGEPALDALLRPTLIASLGQVGDPLVAAEANRLFAAWRTDRDAIPGSLKETWLAIAARNATAQSWDALHSAARSTTGAVERSSLYELLGKSRDEALARRALELAITDEPGSTVSAGMITAVAAEYPAMALDFVLSNLQRVNELVDLSARSRFVGRLVSASSDPALVARLRGYAQANVKQSDRRPIEQAIGQIEWRAANEPRIKAEIVAWLTAHPL